MHADKKESLVVEEAWKPVSSGVTLIINPTQPIRYHEFLIMLQKSRTKVTYQTGYTSLLSPAKFNNQLGNCNMSKSLHSAHDKQMH